MGDSLIIVFIHYTTLVQWECDQSMYLIEYEGEHSYKECELRENKIYNELVGILNELKLFYGVEDDIICKIEDIYNEKGVIYYSTLSRAWRE